MILKMSKNIFQYIIMNIILILLAAISALFVGNGYIIYLLIAGTILFILSMVMKRKLLLDFVFFSMLTYVWIYEIILHYLKIQIHIEIEYLFLIPIFVLFIRDFPKISKCNAYKLIFLLLLIYLMYGGISGKTSLLFGLETMLPYIIAVMMYYIVLAEENYHFKSIYKFIYIICAAATVLQTAVGFNVDQRNGLFGVFGLGAYIPFLMAYPIDTYSKWLMKEKKTKELLFSLIISVVLFFCIESKIAIIIMGLCMILLPVLRQKISVRNMVTFILVFVSLPFLFRAIIEIYPSFGNLLSLNGIYEYFFGNNNWGVYRYGRFEALTIVYGEQNIFNRIFGNGLGTAIPLNDVFRSEAGFEYYVPYFMKEYGSNQGYHLTGLSQVLLDGGIVFFIIFTVILICYFSKAIKGIHFRNKNIFVTSSVCFSMLFLILYSFIYGNIVSHFRYMALVGGVFALLDKQKGENITYE